MRHLMWRRTTPVFSQPQSGVSLVVVLILLIAISVPVSYTHLDVYKRQLCGCQVPSMQWILPFVHGSLEWP